jgi:hypothetical protein
MEIGRKSARLGLLVALATLVSGGAAQLSGPPAACAFTSPLAAPVIARPKPDSPKREVKTIGMLLAEHAPV